MKESDGEFHIVKSPNKQDVIIYKEPNEDESSEDENLLKMVAAEKKGSCKRKDMRIDFEEIGWSSWIIAPSSFDAFLSILLLGQEIYKLLQ